MPDKKNEHIRIGLNLNKNRANSPKQPAFHLWMGIVDGDGFVEGNAGALWMNTGDKCPEDKKAAAEQFMVKLLQAMGLGWIKVTGNLEVQAVYQALGSQGPPESAASPDDDVPF